MGQMDDRCEPSLLTFSFRVASPRLRCVSISGRKFLGGRFADTVCRTRLFGRDDANRRSASGRLQTFADPAETLGSLRCDYLGRGFVVDQSVV